MFLPFSSLSFNRWGSSFCSPPAAPPRFCCSHYIQGTWFGTTVTGWQGDRVALVVDHKSSVGFDTDWRGFQCFVLGESWLVRWSGIHWLTCGAQDDGGDWLQTFNTPCGLSSNTSCLTDKRHSDLPPLQRDNRQERARKLFRMNFVLRPKKNPSPNYWSRFMRHYWI